MGGVGFVRVRVGFVVILLEEEEVVVDEKEERKVVGWIERGLTLGCWQCQEKQCRAFIEEGVFCVPGKADSECLSFDAGVLGRFGRSSLAGYVETP